MELSTGSKSDDFKSSPYVDSDDVAFNLYTSGVSEIDTGAGIVVTWIFSVGVTWLRFIIRGLASFPEAEDAGSVGVSFWLFPFAFFPFRCLGVAASGFVVEEPIFTITRSIRNLLVLALSDAAV